MAEWWAWGLLLGLHFVNFVSPGTVSSFDIDLNQIAENIGWPRNTARSLGVIRGTYLKLPDGVALWHKARDFVPSCHDDLLDALARVQ